MRHAVETGTSTDDRNHEKRYGDICDTPKHSQVRGMQQFALTVIEKALDAIEKDGDPEALDWIASPSTGRLPLEVACEAAGPKANVTAVQDQARQRLEIYYADDDPLEHDEVDDLQVLKDHPLTWMTKRAATERFGVTMSMVQSRITKGTVDSVCAPKSHESNLPVRYVPLSQLKDVFE